MRVRFREPYDYTPSEEPRVLIAFSPTGGADKNGTYTVRRECGEAAVKAGKAVEVELVAIVAADEPGSLRVEGLLGRKGWRRRG